MVTMANYVHTWAFENGIRYLGFLGLNDRESFEEIGWVGKDDVIFWKEVSIVKSCLSNIPIYLMSLSLPVLSKA